MEDFIKKTEEFKRSTVFDTARKQALRERLATHAANHPVRSTWWQQMLGRSPFSNPFTHLSAVRVAGAFSLILVLTGTGVSLAAEQSLPGDLLYPIKIHVTEEARAGLTLSPRAAADWQVARAKRRLTEADALLKRGVLSAEAEAKLKSTFHSDTSDAEQRINDLKAKGDITGAETAARELETVLEASLKTPRKLFEPIDPTDAGKPMSAEDKAKRRASARAELGRISRLRVSLDSSLAAEANNDPARTSSNNAELKLTAALNIVNATQGYIDELRANGQLRSSFAADIKLDLARELVAESRDQLEVNAPEEALRLALQAHKIAGEAKNLVLLKSDDSLEQTLPTPTITSSSATSSSGAAPTVELPVHLNL